MRSWLYIQQRVQIGPPEVLNAMVEGSLGIGSVLESSGGMSQRMTAGPRVGEQVVSMGCRYALGTCMR